MSTTQLLSQESLPPATCAADNPLWFGPSRKAAKQRHPWTITWALIPSYAPTSTTVPENAGDGLSAPLSIIKLRTTAICPGEGFLQRAETSLRIRLSLVPPRILKQEPDLNLV